MNRWLGYLSVLVMLTSCAASGTRETLADLETEQQSQAERLARIQAEIAVAEHRAEEARRRAAYEQCRARAASIDAAVALRRAECAHELAEQQACLASNERDVTGTAVGGCGLGLLVGVLSGGSLAGFTLAGCGAGLVTGEASRDECPAPACLGEAHEWLAVAADAHGHAGLPLCRAGIEIVETVITVPAALQITMVTNGTAAQMAGMQKGDFLFRVAGQPVLTGDGLRAALAGVVPGQPFQVEYVRKGQIRTGWGILTEQLVAAYGRPILGVQYEEGRALRYATVAVSATTSNGGLAVGDRIVAIGGTQPSDAQAVAVAFSAAPSEVLPLTIERDGVTIDIELELIP